MEAKIRGRMRRIEAMARWSRMHGFKGWLPAAVEIEYRTLKGLAQSA